MLPRYYAEKILEKHGADKILFGTDTPWHTPKMEMKLLDNLEIPTSELEKICSGNAKKLLEINGKYVFLPVEWNAVFERDWQMFKNFDKVFKFTFKNTTSQ